MKTNKQKDASGLQRAVSETNHTPPPWKMLFHDDKQSDWSVVHKENDEILFNNYAFDAHPPSNENAAFIVRVVNSHGALLSLAKEYLEYMSKPDKDGYVIAADSVFRIRAERAISQAEGK